MRAFRDTGLGTEDVLIIAIGKNDQAVPRRVHKRYGLNAIQNGKIQ